MPHSTRRFKLLEVRDHIPTITKKVSSRYHFNRYSYPCRFATQPTGVKSRKHRYHITQLRKTTRWTCRPQNCSLPSNGKRTTVPSPLLWLWTLDWHLQAFLQHTTSLHLTLLKSPKLATKLQFGDQPFPICHTFKRALPKKEKNKRRGSGSSALLLSIGWLPSKLGL